MTLQLRKLNGLEPGGEPLHYTACGLDDVYLLNGFERTTIDGEQYVTVEDIDGLWKVIGLNIVTTRKTLAPKEIRFLREHMDLTQAALAARLRVTDQTVARWEKGQAAIQGPADFMLRVLFLACDCAQPEGGKILDRLVKLIDDLIARDEQPVRPVVFRHGMKRWREEPRKAA